MSERELLVERREPVADGVVSLTLASPGGTPLPQWTPGAHIDLVLGNEFVRQYSLCGDVSDRHRYEVAVLREPDGRGGSAFVHDELATGATVRVRGPRDHFPLLDSPSYLFIAGGIGITPILPMLRAAELSGARWRLVYGGRRRASMAFLDRLASYGDRVSVRPQDETGLLDLDELLGAPSADTLVYCCGPEALLTAVEQRCGRWPAGALHVERFAPKPPGGGFDDEPFEVELRCSGRTLAVPAGVSILSVAEQAGVAVLSSCREGTCGTCETGVLGGEPDHRDSVLTAAERAANDVMMICVSRSLGARLVLDL
ncbi:PDR/VanB family oxidoreductase [Micromonospora sp. KC213]|uniref:PDR/VanB family oxidoreductase n=1 Tax=Micromonospora sp. KC213 TaxID=2530378 RepID=UPI0010431041|nr:PDR/VanB family oxidoreductase [Micromonospora sp. KC213]TDC40305.1 oxidoreductase [Micromonospora sp. KC213]